MQKKKKDIIKWIGIIIFIFVAIFSYIEAAHPDWREGKPDSMDRTIVDYINCGQGDSVLILSDGEVTLIDTSTRSETDQILKHLKMRKIQKIDHLVLTHPHEDHIGGAKEILTSYSVDNIYMKRPTNGTEPTSSVYINLLKEIKAQGKSIINAESGKNFTCGQMNFTILGPLEEYEDMNAQSVVLQGRAGKISFIFTGDMESGAEEDLITRFGNTLQSTVLKVGHHGSETSSSNQFLQAVSPRVAVISCGEGNKYGHPHQEVLDRLIRRGVEIYRTDRSGTISILTDGNTMEIQEELK